MTIHIHFRGCSTRNKLPVGLLPQPTSGNSNTIKQTANPSNHSVALEMGTPAAAMASFTAQTTSKSKHDQQHKVCL